MSAETGIRIKGMSKLNYDEYEHRKKCLHSNEEKTHFHLSDSLLK